MDLAIQIAVFLIMMIVGLDRPELAVFGLVVFLTQMPIVLGGIAVANRCVRGSNSSGSGRSRR